MEWVGMVRGMGGDGEAKGMVKEWGGVGGRDGMGGDDEGDGWGE